MQKYNRKCPVCGHINHELYLEETNGYMECEKCGSISNVMEPMKEVEWVPVLSMEDLCRREAVPHIAG